MKQPPDPFLLDLDRSWPIALCVLLSATCILLPFPLRSDFCPRDRCWSDPWFLQPSTQSIEDSVCTAIIQRGATTTYCDNDNDIIIIIIITTKPAVPDPKSILSSVEYILRVCTYSVHNNIPTEDSKLCAWLDFENCLAAGQAVVQKLVPCGC